MNTNLQAVTLELEQTDTSDMDGKYLSFWLDRQLYGISITYVVQIAGMKAVTTVPEFPDYAIGAINLRGSIIPLIDMRLRLGGQETKYNERNCIIITNINAQLTGFIANELDSVILIADNLITPPLSDETSGYITGIGQLEDKTIRLMDIRKILGVEELGC